MSHNDLNLENFSDDREENLRIENEILKLKMQAELGGMFIGNKKIPPEIENQFLRQVQQFEESWQKEKGNYIKVHEFIGSPQFKKAEQLKPGEFKIELDRITRVLQNKNVQLHMSKEYDPVMMYKFITEELFEHEMENILLPGWTMNFIYEEFHPEEDNL